MSERATPGSPEALLRAAQAQGVRDPRVLDAFRRIRREQFVPSERVVEAYRDHPIPIPHGQVTTQPSLVAQMVGALRLDGHERVLEVGTGLGFQTAILAVLARQTFSVERFPDLAELARRNLDHAGVEGATIVVGDGTLGLPDRAPFHGIVISAAAPAVPEPLASQLADGGRLVHPLGIGGNEMVTVYRKEGQDLVRERGVVPAHFVRLVGRHGLPEDS
jgi:protein-L-isoaspartate(D-aspartate) O-methyltransferase